MVKADIDGVRANILAWDDSRLIEEAASHLDKYTSEVKELIREELRRRNIGTEKLDEIRQKKEASLKENGGNALSGIRGALLVFVMFLLFGILSALVNIFLSFPDRMSVIALSVNVSYVIFSTIIIVQMFRKKRSAVILLYIYLSVSGFLSAVNAVSLLVSGGPGRQITTSVLGFFASLAWILYFYCSSRVKKTFVK
jgi:hypothetical protein